MHEEDMSVLRIDILKQNYAFLFLFENKIEQNLSSVPMVLKLMRLTIYFLNIFIRPLLYLLGINSKAVIEKDLKHSCN